MDNSYKSYINEPKYWEFLGAKVEAFLDKNTNGVPYSVYVGLYTAVTDRLSCPTVQTSGQGYSNARLSYASNSELSEEMYLWITDFMATYLGRQRNEAMRREGTELLKFYHDTWSHYEFSARMMESMFGMLSREWIKPENSYGRNVYTISSLLHQMWFTHLLEPIHTHMMKNMLKLVNDRRNNAVIDDAVLRKMPDIFKQHNPPTIRRGIRYTTGVYGMYYESPYITKSIEFHSRRLRNMFSAGRLCEYVHNVHELVAVEDSLASSYMLECSRESLHHMLNQEFIFRVASLILQAVPELLKAMKEDDLHVVYTLFLRIHHEDGLAPMCKLFEEYVIERLTAGSPARTATENSSRAAAENTHAFVSWLLDQYDDLKSVVHRVFGDNELFVASLGASFKDAVNSNELYSSLDRKAPVLIADYISSFLKVGSASFKQLETSVADPEDEIAVRVRRVMGVLWFVKEKDTFVRFYNLELSKRLVAEQTISFSLELTIGGIIKEAVGAAGTLQLDDMLKDIQISKNLTHEFASNKRSQGVNVDVKVLKAVTWSHHLPESNPKLPPMLDSIRQDFTVVYKKAHAGRDLAWLWQESKAEIRLFLPTAKGAAGRNGYTVIVTTYQLAIFGMFTADSGPGTGYDSAKGPTLTCAEVQKGTDMTKDQTIAELTYLVKSRIFVATDKELNTSTRIRFNDRFQSKQLRINLSEMRWDQKQQEIKQTLKEVMCGRENYLRALIVRIMKQRKMVTHKALQKMVFEEGEKRTTFDLTHFREAIEFLIDREYLERDETDRSIYIYLA